jgi:hypothetical protein
LFAAGEVYGNAANFWFHVSSFLLESGGQSRFPECDVLRMEKRAQPWIGGKRGGFRGRLGKRLR